MRHPRWKPFRFFPSILECEDRRPASTFLGVADAFVADTASLSLEPQPTRFESMLDSDVAVGVPSNTVGIVELDTKIDSMPPARTNPAFVDQVFSSGSAISSNTLADLDEPMLMQLAAVAQSTLMARFGSSVETVPVPSAGPQAPNSDPASPPELPLQSDLGPIESGFGGPNFGPGGGGTLDPLSGGSPSANNDAYALDEDHVLTVDTPGVLANDTGTGTLQAILVSEPLHGVLELYDDGGFIYTPEIDYFGADSFTYKVSDGTSESNVATVSFTIQPINDVPIANNEDYYVRPDQPFTLPGPGVMANDYDYDGDPITATLDGQVPPEQLTLNPNGSFTYDPTYDSQTEFTYTLSDGQGGNSTATITFHLIDGVILDATELSLAESEPAAVLSVIRPENDLSSDLIVSYTLAGTAVNGADFETLPGTVVIPAGERSAEIVIEPVDDDLHEGEEYIELMLVEGPGYTPAYPFFATVTLTSEDLPVVTVEYLDGTLAEDGAGQASFRVSRTNEPWMNLSVQVSWSGLARNGQDYESLPDYIDIPEGSNSVLIPLTPLDDDYLDPDETVRLTLLSDPTYVLGAQTFAQTSILSDPDDTVNYLTIEVVDPVVLESDPNDTAVLTVRRTGSVAEDLEIMYGVTGSAGVIRDYPIFWPPFGPPRLVIPAGSATANIVIHAVNDQIDEPAETVTVNFMDCTVYDYDYAPIYPGGGSGGTSWGTIQIISEPPPYNDPIPIVATTPPDPNAVDLGLDPGQFVVSREGGDSSQPLTVSFLISGTASPAHYRLLDANGQPVSGSITIAAGQASATITVDAFGDIPDDVEYQTVVLSLWAGLGYEVAQGRGQAEVKVENAEFEIDPVTGGLDDQGNSKGTVITAESPWNVVKNPAAIVRWDLPRLPDPAGQLPIVEITRTNAPQAYNRVFWQMESDTRFVEAPPAEREPGGAAQFVNVQAKQPTEYGSGKTVYVNGVTPGRVRLLVKLANPDGTPNPQGKLLSRYEAIVVERKYVKYRVNLLKFANANDVKSAFFDNVQTVIKHIEIAKRYLRQAGILLVADTNPAIPNPLKEDVTSVTPAQDAQGKALPGLFKVVVSNSSLLQSVERQGDTGADSIRVNNRYGVVQINYVVDLDNGAPASTTEHPSPLTNLLTRRYIIEVDKQTKSRDDASSRKWSMRLDPEQSARKYQRTLVNPGEPAWGMLVTDAFRLYGMADQHYGNAIAHEMGHVLGLLHRGKTKDRWDQLEKPSGDRNLMVMQNVGGRNEAPVNEDIDLIQAVAVWGSKATLEKP